MIQENIAELVGTLKFKVDARPLVAFEKRLEKVTTMLQQFGEAANKKFNIKVSLDSRTLRAQLDKATAAKIAFKNFSVNEEALMMVSKQMAMKLDKTPIRLSNIKVDISDLIAQKRFVKTLLGQMQIDLPMTIKFKQAEKMLREWKKVTEEKFTLRVNADISQARFLKNARASIKAAQEKIGTMTINVTDPKLRLKVDQPDLRAQIKAAISAHEFDVKVNVKRGKGQQEQAPRHERSSLLDQRRERNRDMLGLGGAAGAGMGFMRGAIPGLGAAFAFSQLNQINQQMQAQQNAMTAVMGSEEAGKVQSQWVKDLSNQIGLEFREVAPSFNKMLASGQTSGMSTDAVQTIFQGVSEYGRTMGLDSEAMKGSMRAIEQMMNKGQVMSEELKGQLAERMPGAMSAMAEAAGFGNDEKAVAKLMEAMKNGDVKSGDVLEKFANILALRARQGGALNKAMESTAAQQARMNNAFTDIVGVFSEAGFDKGMGKFFKALADGMEKATPGIHALGEAFLLLVEPINAAINVGATLLEQLPKIAALFGMTAGEFTALGTAALIASTPIGAVAVALGLVALAIDDLIVYTEGGESLFGRWLKINPEAFQAMEEIKGHFDEMKTIFKDIIDLTGTLGEDLKGLSLNEMLVSTLQEIEMIMNGLVSLAGRITLATQFSKTAEGTADPQIMRFLKGFVNGPEYMYQEMDAMGVQHAEPSLKNQGNITQQDIADLAAAIREAQLDDVLSTPSPTITFEPGSLAITVEGVLTPDDLISQMRDPMERIAKDAFNGAAADLFTGIKENK